MTALLKQIRLAGFQSIRDQTIELGPRNVLIGANGAGKSNLLRFFRLFEALALENLRLFVAKEGTARSLLHFGPETTSRIRAELVYRGDGSETRYAFELAHAPEDRLVFGAESASLHTQGRDLTGAIDLGMGHVESALGDPTSPGIDLEQSVCDCLRGMRSYHFHDTSTKAAIRGTCEVDANRYPRTYGENLAAYLLRLRDERRPYYDRILRTVQRVAPFLRDFSLEPQRGRVMLRWYSTESEWELGPHQLSDGTLRFIGLSTVLLQPEDEQPSLIVLDEPELGLHPAAISVLGGLLRSASASTQILVATQSPLVLDEFDAEDVIVTELEDGASVFRRLDPEELSDWLESYSVAELWEKNVVGGRPR